MMEALQDGDTKSGVIVYKTMDSREVTSSSNTLEEAIRSARNAWSNGSDDRFFMIVNPSGSTVAVVQRAQVTMG